MIRSIETIALTVFGILAFFIVVSLFAQVRGLPQRVHAEVAALSGAAR